LTVDNGYNIQASKARIAALLLPPCGEPMRRVAVAVVLGLLSDKNGDFVLQPK
jgi:hypothetical protein